MYIDLLDTMQMTFIGQRRTVSYQIHTGCAPPTLRVTGTACHTTTDPGRTPWWSTMWISEALKTVSMTTQDWYGSWIWISMAMCTAEQDYSTVCVLSTCSWDLSTWGKYYDIILNEELLVLEITFYTMVGAALQIADGCYHYEEDSGEASAVMPTREDCIHRCLVRLLSFVSLAKTLLCLYLMLLIMCYSIILV